MNRFKALRIPGMAFAVLVLFGGYADAAKGVQKNGAADEVHGKVVSVHHVHKGSELVTVKVHKQKKKMNAAAKAKQPAAANQAAAAPKAAAGKAPPQAAAANPAGMANKNAGAEPGKKKHSHHVTFLVDSKTHVTSAQGVKGGVKAGVGKLAARKAGQTSGAHSIHKGDHVAAKLHHHHATSVVVRHHA